MTRTFAIYIHVSFGKIHIHVSFYQRVLLSDQSPKFICSVITFLLSKQSQWMITTYFLSYFYNVWICGWRNWFEWMMTHSTAMKLQMTYESFISSKSEESQIQSIYVRKYLFAAYLMMIMQTFKEESHCRRMQLTFDKRNWVSGKIVSVLSHRKTLSSENVRLCFNKSLLWFNEIALIPPQNRAP